MFGRVEIVVRLYCTVRFRSEEDQEDCLKPIYFAAEMASLFNGSGLYDIVIVIVVYQKCAALSWDFLDVQKEGFNTIHYWLCNKSKLAYIQMSVARHPR